MQVYTVDKKGTRASVAMAVCNGEKYIKEQVESILGMMNENDELVISYDVSTDETLRIIKEFAIKDKRVHIVFDKGRGVESNFNCAVSHCKGRYIFLADQDDVWINNKINIMIRYFENNPKTVILIADGYITDEKLQRKGNLFHSYRISKSAIRNFMKGTYLGCQMGFRIEIKDRVWPVSVNPPLAHDLWLGVAGSLFGDVQLINEKLIEHRLHENNFSNSSQMSIVGIIKNRVYFACRLLEVILKKKMIGKG